MKTRNVVLTIVLAGVILPFYGCEPYQHPTTLAERSTFDKDVLYHLEKNPRKYLGELYAFHGRVIQAQESSSEIVFQILTADWFESYPTGSSLIVTFDRSDTPIVEESWVNVLGYIGPTIEGQNAFGARVSSLTMDAIAVNVGGMHYYYRKDEEIVKRWISGELFGSCDRSRPKVPEKTDQNKSTPK